MDPARELRSAVASWDGVVEGTSKFGAGTLAFFVRGREFLHFHRPTRIDVRMTKRGMRHLSPEARSIPRRAASDWVELRLEDARDLTVALAAARVAWQHASKPTGSKPAASKTSTPRVRRASRKPRTR